jgi:predicted site-specific integrase-resolvase
MSKLLTKYEVCELLRCSARTLDRWRSMWKAKKIDVGEVKIRKKVRFRQEAIEKLLSSPKLWMPVASAQGQ